MILGLTRQQYAEKVLEMATRFQAAALSSDGSPLGREAQIRSTARFVGVAINTLDQVETQVGARPDTDFTPDGSTPSWP